MYLTRSLREPEGPCTKSMEVSESRMERVNTTDFQKRNTDIILYISLRIKNETYVGICFELHQWGVL